MELDFIVGMLMDMLVNDSTPKVGHLVLVRRSGREVLPQFQHEGAPLDTVLR